MTSRHVLTSGGVAGRWATRLVLVTALVTLVACGGDETAGEGSAQQAASPASPGPRVTVNLGADRHVFSGARCFASEDGGSDGALSVNKFTSDDGAELSIDWAGDSPGSSMVRIDLPDGTQLEATTFGASPDRFEVSVSGQAATVETTLRTLMAPAAEPLPATIEVRCR